MPVWMYAACAPQSHPPSEQIGSLGTHKSMVFAAYSGPTCGCGPGESESAKLLEGPPKSAAATTWSATGAGSAVVTRSITPAPWEYPPNTIRVPGQLAASDWMCALASSAPAGVLVSKSRLAG